jgi:hypothetical protein
MVIIPPLTIMYYSTGTGLLSIVSNR